MSHRPDYETAREEAGFTWYVAATQGAIRKLAEIPIREFNLEPRACIEAYRRGRPMLREMFGDDVRPLGLSTPAISYGHANGLGSELIFPEGGEVAHTHPYESIEQGIQALHRPVDFASAGMAPFYLDFRRQMQEAFPDEQVGFSYGDEGPLTTAYEMRGEGFFTDIFDEPTMAKEFLALLTGSILEFHGFRANVNGSPVVNPAAGGLCDDVASMIPPHMFDEFVIPFWEQYYGGVTTGRRHAHVEDLRPSQLPFLETIGLSFYDPSISGQLNPRLIVEHCRVPFTWRVAAIHYPTLSTQDVADFVYQAVADGASGVHTHVAETMCNDDGVRKIHSFIEAARQTERLLAEGARRDQIGQRVTPEGRTKFWDHWFK
jgi:hypothetical protein